MLVRILTDNPGETFTRNLDERFVDTVRALLKNVRDRSVWQILMETLDDFEYNKMNDQNLAPLVLMWKKEKVVAMNKYDVGLSSRERFECFSVPYRPTAHQIFWC